MDAEAAAVRLVGIIIVVVVGWRGDGAGEEAVFGKADEDVAGRLPAVEVHFATGYGAACRGVRSHGNAGW